MRITIDKDVAMTTRDGTSLMSDVYRPEGGPWPALVARLPYNKEIGVLALAQNGFDLMRAVKAGYAVVVQDTRGRFASGGDFTPFAHEATDGAETIEWAADQAWSTGAVGMVGGSYLGATQWTAATQAPPALKAIAPAVTSSQFHDGWTHQGGALQLGFDLWWALSVLGAGELQRRRGRGDPAAGRRLAELTASADDHARMFERRPLVGLPELADVAGYYDEWLAHPDDDAFWRSTAPSESYAEITAPALNIGGWFDVFLSGTIANYTGMRARGGSEEARRRQRLVIGPWAHGNLTGTFPEATFGVTAGIHGAVDSTGLQLDWFDWLLKGEGDAPDPDRPVRLFVMGPDEWRDFPDWPPPETRNEDWYLHSDGRANTATGDGALSRSAPSPDEPEDAYLFDPRNPVPTTGGATYLPGLLVGANTGPRDQRVVETRADVLCYTSDPLTEPLEVIGDLHVILHVSSSAPDTDFTAKLVNVAPDGRAMGVADGILRARYRHSRSTPSPLRPDQVSELRIDLGATAIVLPAGHRVRVEVSSSNFPRFDRNTNTGGPISSEGDADVRSALNRVHHTSTYASRLVLPVTGAAPCA